MIRSPLLHKQLLLSLTVRSSLHHKHYKHQNPQAPISIDPQALIFAANTDPQASKPKVKLFFSASIIEIAILGVLHPNANDTIIIYVTTACHSIPFI